MIKHFQNFFKEKKIPFTLRFSHSQDLKWIKTPDPNEIKNSSENELDHEEGSLLRGWELNGVNESEEQKSLHKMQDYRPKERYLPLAFGIANFLTLFISISLSVAYHWNEILEKGFCSECKLEVMPKEHSYLFKFGTIISSILAGFTFFHYYQYSKQRFSVPENRKHYYFLQINMGFGLMALIFLILFGIAGEENDFSGQENLTKKGNF